MPWDTDSFFDLYRPVSRDRALVSVVPRPLVLLDSLRRYAKAPSKLGVRSRQTGGFSDRVHVDYRRTSGSNLQRQAGTDSSGHSEHDSGMRMESENQRREFSARLARALDAARYPPMQKGRADRVAHEMRVSPKTASNWLTGAKLPQLDRMIELAERLQVSFDWLATGRGKPGLLTAEECEHIEELRGLTEKDRENVLKITHVFRGQAGPEDGDVA